MSTFRLPVEQVGLEQSIQRAMRKFQNNPLKINVDDKSFTQPLGRITASADEFTKSIEASNARVVAFGASVAVINSIQNAFKQLVVQTVQVEKSLAEINVVLGATSANLENSEITYLEYPKIQHKALIRSPLQQLNLQDRV